MDLSVVIPTAGKWDRLRLGLGSLLRQRLESASWEVVLVADGVAVPDELCAGSRLRVEALPRALGRGGARNHGIRAAAGEIVILLDDDMVVGEGFLAQHWRAHRSSGATGGRLCKGLIRELPGLVYAESLRPLRLAAPLTEHARRRVEPAIRAVVDALEDFPACWETHGRMSRIERDGLTAWQAARPHLMWVGFAGANLSAPRRLLLEHPFDESAGTRWGLEDLALALRFLVRGGTLSVVPGARALHLTHARGRWRDDLSASQACLDFVPVALATAVVDYLKEEGSIDELEPWAQFLSDSRSQP